jgi:PEP-CTERM motif
MKTTHPVLRASALAVGFALASMAAQAQTTTFMQATGAYNLGNGASTFSVTDGGSSFNPAVDVLEFAYGTNSAGMHSYGSTTGNFGSRSSGSGIYDVTGSFKIIQSFTNTSGNAASAAFNFYITPGMLSNYIGSAPLTGAEFVKAGISFDVKLTKSGATNTVFGSAATLQTTVSGTTYTASGDTSLYTGGGTNYTINGVEKSVDLGVINAGQTIELTYELKTFASGVSSSTGTRDVPATTYVIPAHWYDPCSGEGYGYGQVAADANTCPVFRPEETVTVPGYTISDGTPSSSHANAGDPFSIDLANGNPSFANNGTTPLGFTGGVVLAPVPEPGTWGLMALGLGAVGWAARRKKAATA